MFGIFKKKQNKNVFEKRLYLDLYKLSKVLIIKSNKNILEWIIGEHEDFTKEMFIINNNISIILTSVWTADEGGLLCLGWLHYLRLDFEIKVNNVLTDKYSCKKDLMDYKLDDLNYEIKDNESYHELTNEWINIINNWSSNICKKYDDKNNEN